MNKIALFGKFNDNMKKLITELKPDNFEIIVVDNLNDLYKLNNVEYIINRSFVIDKDIIDKCSSVKLIQKWGVGYDKIDIIYAAKKDIPVAICTGVNSQPVAEMAVLLTLALYRNLLPLHKKIQQNIWAKDEYVNQSYMIKDKTVGIIGIGSIGKKVGSILKSFGAIINYYDIYKMSEEDERVYGFKHMEFDALLRTSDIISLHLPLLNSTKGLINKDCFLKMKPSAIIINTARGGIINQEDLIFALQNKLIAGAGLDTVEREPIEPESPLLKFENVVLTPHCGGNTADNDINMVRSCYNNILRFENGEDLPNNTIVNKQYLNYSLSI